jgi:dephospho-CoA kinase
VLLPIRARALGFDARHLRARPLPSAPPRPDGTRRTVPSSGDARLAHTLAPHDPHPAAPEPHAALPALPRSGTLVIGLLGGVAAGKSACARHLAGANGVVLDADSLAHAALASTELRAPLLARFGPAAFDADGAPDRAALARAAFADPSARAALEAWIHPRVRDTIRARLAQARERGVPRVVLDVPLLLENDREHGLARICDLLVFVDAPEAAREARARGRAWPAGQREQRERAQLPLADKRARAHALIPNHGSLDELRAALDALDARIEAARTRT